MMPFPVVNDCCCTEDDDSPRVDELRDEVGRVTGGLSAKASPTMRATANRPATATRRSRFKAIEVVRYGIILGTCIIRRVFDHRVRSTLTMIEMQMLVSRATLSFSPIGLPHPRALPC